ncbi:Gfo/Idh/MocA family oxidoreductase [Arthrobacter sp. 2MCAF15]|uniref:Gfo/Idh/MocA family oxidoreductase n=1 Tax=Arthrobacter sp. 2MCAF15 TaxID=3232984 RepID=UPI003F8F472D
MKSSTTDRTPLRAAVIGTGLLAQHLYSYSSQDDVEIVAVGSSNPQKLGIAAAEHFGVDGPEITIQETATVLDRPDIDVVLHAGPQDTVWDAFEQCAARGLDVLTTAGGYHRSEQLDRFAQEEHVVRLAERNGARLLGTGIFPGFTADVLPIALARLMPGPVNLTIRIISDIGPWSEKVLRKEIGVGGPLREAELDLFDYVKASARIIVDSISSARVQWTYRSDLLTSTELVSIGPVVVPPGNVAGFSLQAVAKLDESVVDVTWESSLGGAEAGGTIVASSLDHGFNITTRIAGTPAYPATAARLLNSVRPLRTLPPGLRQAFEVPLATVWADNSGHH